MIKIKEITITTQVGYATMERKLDDIIIDEHPVNFFMSIYASSDGILITVREEKPMKFTFEKLPSLIENEKEEE